MVKCEDCKQEMLGSDSCTFLFIKLKGRWYKRNTDYFFSGYMCGDCAIVNKKGNIHHFGCDIERCPRCKGQLLSCGCVDQTTQISNNKK